MGELICPRCDLRFEKDYTDCWGMDVAECPNCRWRFLIGEGAMLPRSLTYNVAVPPERCPIHNYRPEIIVKDENRRELSMDSYEKEHQEGESLDDYLNRVGVRFTLWCQRCQAEHMMFTVSMKSLEDMEGMWRKKVEEWRP
ncbi:MAG: hypothetical protein IJX35_00215 [Candidatus Methanomethylophilaceae archaeon]|nr:hypothetical protein [Candidatus Methanomethylophilaceae archaeon]